MADDTPVYPIRTVAELTGVNPVTLRAWERRYGLIRPQRTAKGHRLYSENDIARIRRIVELLDRGVLISRAREALTAEESGEELAAGEAPWPAWRSHLGRALAHFEPTALDGALSELLSLYPVDRAASHVLLPVLKARLTGDAEAVAEGHLLATYLRGRLGHLVNRTPARGTGVRILLAAPPQSESSPGITGVALCILALTALNRGHRPVLLGEAVPSPAIAAGVRRAAADHLLIYGDAHPGAAWGQAVAELTAAWPGQTAVTGPAAEQPDGLPPEVRVLVGEPHQAIDRLCHPPPSGA
ncbi:MerR family transcriptional regulator [Halorhodospira halophila]|uniref:Transcriptional regulator, MerR family n=1 Tax=Halorhodospira halophila (strain DSM 244 / SL1) TaxID=349124 RepID=A1WVH8_HALHL|nr:MerR family transcriptional regulator [Halorhodospira halophila]ABM61690.1 transcriptional regulator, MerR family [Halorhodospira halophila SL1]MBK1728979.1 MerR family transcriptional regulator [Halorhodospira halophila]